MKLKYAGPKPIISYSGVDFDNNKEDKYVYLHIVAQILKSLDHEYVADKIYTYDTNLARFSDDELFEEFKKICQDITNLINSQDHNIHDEIEHNIKRAHENSVLSPEEKAVLMKNIELMQDYMAQRSINKRVYYCAVDRLATVIEKHKISHVVLPMYQKFVHVLHSIQGSLSKQKRAVDSTLEIYQENGTLLVKLKISH